MAVASSTRTKTRTTHLTRTYRGDPFKAPVLARWENGRVVFRGAPQRNNVAIIPLGVLTEGHIQTRSGKVLYFAHPTPEMIDPCDIARGLSYECRYANQTEYHYSVGQHSVLGAWYFLARNEIELAWHFLFHDATEAYMKDLPTDLKAMLPFYKWLEDNLWTQAIAPRFGIKTGLVRVIKECDNRIVANERPQVLGPAPEGAWKVTYPPLEGVKVRRWSMKRTEREWLKCYETLQDSRTAA